MNGSRKRHARSTNDDLFQSSQLSNASSCIIGYGNESQIQGPYGMSLTMSVGEQNDSSQSQHENNNTFSSSLPVDNGTTGDIFDCDEDSLERGYRRNETRVKSNESKGGAFDDLERLVCDGASISGSDDEYESSESDVEELKESSSTLRENESDRPNTIADNVTPPNHSSSLCYAEGSPRKDSMEGDNDSLQSPTNSISLENEDRHVHLDKTPNTSMANKYNHGGSNRSQGTQTRDKSVYSYPSIVSAKSQTFKTPRTMEQLLQKQRKRIMSSQRTSSQKHDHTPRRVSTAKKINTTTSTTSTRSLDSDDFTSRLVFKNGKLKSSIKRRQESLSQMSPGITQTQSFPRSGSMYVSYLFRLCVLSASISNIFHSFLIFLVGSNRIEEKSD